MKFEDAPLKSYLIKSLQPLTAADPSILANYVVALLKNNKPKKELQKSCNEKLYDFLGEETKQFVSKLFHDLEDGSLTEAPEGSVVPPGEATEQKSSPTQAKQNASGNDADESSDDEDDDRNHKHRRRVSRSRSSDKEDDRSHYRKRSRSTENGHYSRDNHRYYENRRSSYRGRDREQQHSLASRIVVDGTVIHGRGGLPFRGDRFFGAGIQRGVGGGRGGSWLPAEQQRFGASFPDGEFAPGLLAQGPSAPNMFGGRVAGNGRGGQQGQWGNFGLLGNGALEHVLPLTAARSNPVAAISAISRPRCLDFEERGFCLRGDLCPMEHGANRIVVEDVQSLSKLTLPISNTRNGGADPSTSSEMAARSTRGNRESAGGEEPNPGSTVSDSYDPDQPLWGKEQSDKVRQYHSEQQRHEWENSADAKDQELLKPSSDDATNKQQALDPSLTVWDRIGPVDYHRSRLEAGARSSGVKRQRGEEQEEGGANGSNGALHGDKRKEKGGERAQRTLYIRCIPNDSNRVESLKAHFSRFGEVVDIRKPAHFVDRAFVQFAQPEHAEAALASPDAVLGNRFIRVSWANRDNRVDVRQAQAPENGASAPPPAAAGAPPVAAMKKAPVPGPENGALVQKKQEELEVMREEIRKKQEALAAKRDEFKRKLQKLSKQSKTAPDNSVSPAEIESKTPTKAAVKASPVARPAQPFPTNAASAWGRYKLDNRTAVFRVLAPPPAAISELGGLKEHFATFGEVSELKVDHSPEGGEAKTIQVTFATRRDAEKAFSQGNVWQGEQLQFSWVNAAPASAAPPQASSVATAATAAAPEEAPSHEPEAPPLPAAAAAAAPAVDAQS